MSPCRQRQLDLWIIKNENEIWQITEHWTFSNFGSCEGMSSALFHHWIGFLFPSIAVTFTRNIEELFVLFAAQTSVSIRHFDGELLGAFDDGLALLRGNAVSDFCAVLLVLHEKNLQLLKETKEEQIFELDSFHSSEKTHE